LTISTDNLGQHKQDDVFEFYRLFLGDLQAKFSSFFHDSTEEVMVLGERERESE